MFDHLQAAINNAKSQYATPASQHDVNDAMLQALGFITARIMVLEALVPPEQLAAAKKAFMGSLVQAAEAQKPQDDPAPTEDKTPEGDADAA